MKKLLLVTFTSILLISAMAFAAKPGTQPEAAPELRVLWSAPDCSHFTNVDNGHMTWVREGTNQWYIQSQSSGVFQFGATQAEMIDWLINLFIRINGLDATTADVPVDGAGQYDCLAWNSQLMSP